MSELHNKVTEHDYCDADRQIREEFTVIIDDNKIQDELLAKLIEKSTPDDPPKIPRKVEAERAEKHATENDHKHFKSIQHGKGDQIWVGLGSSADGEHGGCDCSQSKGQRKIIWWL